MTPTPVGAALVIGGGIGGMQAALDLAESAFKVYLLEKNPAIGGTMVKLDKTFPTNDCAMCTIAPRLVGTGGHPNIEILTYSDLVSIEGEAGNFQVTILKKTRYVDESKCTGCGLCALNCPVEAVDTYNFGMIDRAAIYLNYPQAIPRVFTINREVCIGCGICETVCGPNAIQYAGKDETIQINVGAIIAVPGLDVYDPTAQGEYGYGRFRNVVTGIEFERILSPSGPYRGMVLRPGDGKVPRKIAFIQCVGSRREDRNWCSAVCCMAATKQSLVAMEHEPDLHSTIFFIDFRAFGKGFDAFYERAKESGVEYIRALPSSIKEIRYSHKLIIEYAPPGNSGIQTSIFDMVVLSCGFQPTDQTHSLAEELGIQLTPEGFCQPKSALNVSTSREGIYAAGPFVEPKDIPETIIQASGAAAQAMILLAESRGTLVSVKDYPPELDVAGQEPRIGVFVCHCGTNIAGVVDVAAVSDYAATLPDVIHSEHNMFTCSTDSQSRIENAIDEHKLNRVVVASCTPRTHERLFQNTIREAGLNSYLFEFANIRDQCSWVHRADPKGATKKAKDLVRMAVAKARLLNSLERKSLEFNHDALVIGGGLAGMTAALNLADQGFIVSLIERESSLGGNMRHLHSLLSPQDPQALLKTTIERIHSHPNIKTFMESEIDTYEGSLGKFITTLKQTNGTPQIVIHHGVTIVATGAQPYIPNEYLYGQDPRVITQLELEEFFIPEPEKLSGCKSIVMIQCVGSRNAEHPYCSRLCCSQAIKNAFELKKLNPEMDVFILYRDIRTYGLLEQHYRRAREAGVAFLRYEEPNPPKVAVNVGLEVTIRDEMLGEDILLQADIVVLSVATLPRSDAAHLAQLLKVPLTQDGFFQEAHLKLAPVDFATEGIFLCGMAHYPKKAVTESIVQASAAAGRAASWLSKPMIEIEPTISHVVETRCDGCAYCVDPCPFKAITLIEYTNDEGNLKKRVVIDETMCKGCGTCQATCPKDAIFVWHFKLEQLRAMTMAALNK